MPRVTFEPENKAATVNFDFPKLKLKKGEKARVLVGLEDPLVEYVHTLRKPVIVNGVPKMVTRERKNGDTFQTNQLDFISRPICLGDGSVLQADGSDPKNCPMCKLAKEYPDYTTAPQRRYAMHVIRYRTKAGSEQVAIPFSVEVLVWSFTDQIFNKLVDLKTEWGDLRKHDLILGPCSDETFQKFDISPSQKAEWLADEDRKKLTVLTFRENQIPDLTIATGSAKQRSWVDQDIQQIMEAWAQVNGAEDTSSTGLDTDLADLLGGSDDSELGDADLSGLDSAEEAADNDEGETAESSELDDLFAGDLAVEEHDPDSDGVVADLPDPEPAPAPATKKPAAKAAAPKAAPEAVDNFDDLLANL